MYLNEQHRDKLSEIQRQISNLYYDCDVTTRGNVIWEIRQRFEDMERTNVISFFTCGGDKPQSIGTIKLENSVYVTDPCYEPGIWCSGKVDNLKAGIWNCFRKVGYTDWGFRIAELIIRHEDYPEGEIENFMEGVDVGVDSGQAGFFDAPYYEDCKSEEKDEEWYDRVSDLTLGEHSCGTIDMKGVVASSGFGDGGYDLYTHEEGGKVVAMRIVFITQKELDEYREEWLKPKPVNGGGA